MKKSRNNHEAVSSHGGGARTGKNQFYIPVNEARHMWEMGMAVSWSDRLVPECTEDASATYDIDLRSDPAFASDVICAK
jgi:hypothetical protein